MRSNYGLTLLILFLTSLIVVGQSSGEKPTKAKRVFTNEDLGKFREKHGSELDSEPAMRSTQPAETAKQAVQPGVPGKAETPENKAYWVAKLKEMDSALAKAKEQELKFQGLVEKYGEKLREAKGDFHTRTSQEQLADSMKNLSRAKDETKQGEETKAKLLGEAAEKGFKPSDLRDEAPR